MSVTTIADENLRTVKKHLEDAEKILRHLPDDWGFDEYSIEVQTKILEAPLLIRKILAL